MYVSIFYTFYFINTFVLLFVYQFNAGTSKFSNPVDKSYLYFWAFFSLTLLSSFEGIAFGIDCLEFSLRSNE